VPYHQIYSFEPFHHATPAPPQATLVESRPVPEVSGEYLRYEVPSSFGTDKFELLLKADKGPDGSPELLVTYRSLAGDVKYLFPLQTPMSDGGVQKKRMEELRAALQWESQGCYDISCYEGELVRDGVDLFGF
jgi:hypothetical protein